MVLRARAGSSFNRGWCLLRPQGRADDRVNVVRRWRAELDGLGKKPTAKDISRCGVWGRRVE